MKSSTFFFFIGILLFSSCIGDDIIMDEVDPVIRIQNPIDSIAINTAYQFEYSYLNKVGMEEDVIASWFSSNPDVLQINETGLAQALQVGSANISVEYDNGSNTISDLKTVYVRDTTIASNSTRSGTIASTGSYQLEGDFTLELTGDSELVLSFADNYAASTNLPGLYIYLTNNPSTNTGAFEIGVVEVYAGSHSYNLGNIGLFDYSHVLYYCKPFNVKVGDGEIN